MLSPGMASHRVLRGGTFVWQAGGEVRRSTEAVMRLADGLFAGSSRLGVGTVTTFDPLTAPRRGIASHADRRFTGNSRYAQCVEVDDWL